MTSQIRTPIEKFEAVLATGWLHLNYRHSSEALQQKYRLMIPLYMQTAPLYIKKGKCGRIVYAGRLLLRTYRPDEKLQNPKDKKDPIIQKRIAWLVERQHIVKNIMVSAAEQIVNHQNLLREISIKSEQKKPYIWQARTQADSFLSVFTNIHIPGSTVFMTREEMQRANPDGWYDLPAPKALAHQKENHLRLFVPEEKQSGKKILVQAFTECWKILAPTASRAVRNETMDLMIRPCKANTPYFNKELAALEAAQKEAATKLATTAKKADICQWKAPSFVTLAAQDVPCVVKRDLAANVRPAEHGAADQKDDVPIKTRPLDRQKPDGRPSLEKGSAFVAVTSLAILLAVMQKRQHNSCVAPCNTFRAIDARAYEATVSALKNSRQLSHTAPYGGYIGNPTATRISACG